MNKVFLPAIGLSSVLLTLGSSPDSAFAKSVKVGDLVISRPIYLAQTVPSTTTIEQQVLTQINRHRATRGLPALVSNSTVVQQARLHSQNMAAGRVPFGHQGFSLRMEAIARVFPIRAGAENVAYNRGYSDPATTAVRGWLNSPGHKFNIEGSYNLTGVGVARSSNGAYYFTQIFVRNR